MVTFDTDTGWTLTGSRSDVLGFWWRFWLELFLPYSPTKARRTIVKIRKTVEGASGAGNARIKLRNSVGSTAGSITLAV